MLKNYKQSVDMLLESIEKLSESLENDDVQNTANYTIKAATQFEILIPLIGAELSEYMITEDFPSEIS